MRSEPLVGVKRYLLFVGLVSLVSVGLLAVVSAYQSGGPPSFFGHFSNEIEYLFTPRVGSCGGQFCDVSCLAGEKATSGRCESSNGYFWISVGVGPGFAFGGPEDLECIDGSTGPAPPSMEAEVNCWAVNP